MVTIYRNNSIQTSFDEFKIDCSQCSGLCCVALFFSKVDGFPHDKKAGIPCQNLETDFKCKIHKHLLDKKMHGCISYDCFGAGQIVTLLLYDKMNWANSKDLQKDIFHHFLMVYKLQQMRWYLSQCLDLAHMNDLDNKINILLSKLTEGLLNISNLDNLNLVVLQTEVNEILKTVSQRICSSWSDKIKKPMFAKNFKKQKIVNRDFSMTLLIGSDFSESTLIKINFLGSDLRQVNFKGANLYESLFLTQGQINSAIGDKATILPPYLYRPSSWL